MKQLLREGVKIAEIARRLGVSRQTIYNWKTTEAEGVSEKDRPRRASKLDPFRNYIESRLDRFDLPATVLLREIRDMGYTGGITILRQLVASIKDRHVRRLVDRFETEPGRQAQVDFGHCGTIRHHGRNRRLSLIVVVLGYSRAIWARFVLSQRQPVLMECLEDAFRELGGVPRELLVDNLKQVVARPRSEDEAAVIQPSFVEFADHWGFEVVACPVYWPRAKGKVERAIQYIKTSFLEGRTFVDLDDLNGQLRVWLSDVANVRVHGTTKERPVDRLEAELEAMLPLGCGRAFPSGMVEGRCVDHDARISYHGVQYSVDPTVVLGRRGVPVEVHRATDDTIRIYHEGRLVGTHQMQPKGSPPVDDPRHAALRRELRQKPPMQRPHGKNPLFIQIQDAVTELDAGAPAVQQRDLAAYEGAL